MARAVPAIAARHQRASTTAAESSDFDRRWAAWQARGAARDRAFRRKMAVVAPILVIVAVVIIYVLSRR